MLNKYSLTIEDSHSRYKVWADEPVSLREIGKTMHAVAKHKPMVTLFAPDDRIIAKMDEWAVDWTDQQFPKTPEQADEDAQQALAAALLGDGNAFFGGS